LRTIEFTSVNIATLPPIPMPRERTAVAVKPGAERRLRYALRRFSITNASSGFEVSTNAFPSATFEPGENMLWIQYLA
jgi:hypothetical protein